MIQVIAVVGPTASGKSALGLELAERLQTEIISADSQQFYRGMEIGTAAPAHEERARVPHHFVCCLDPGESMAAGEFERLARPVVHRLNSAGKIAVTVGGSGLYVQALLEGLFEGPARNQLVRDRLRAEARELGNQVLFDRLQVADPDYAAALTSPNDLVRIIRALEVFEITGKPVSQLHREYREAKPPLDAVRIALDWPRESLYGRIDRRVDEMIAAGWIEEVKALLDAGHRENIHRLKPQGYRELVAYLDGVRALEETVDSIKQNTRRLAKRQLTWFRADKSIHWLPAGPERPLEALVDEALALVSGGNASSRP